MSAALMVSAHHLGQTRHLELQVCRELMVSMELLMLVAAMLAFDTLFVVMTVMVKKALDGGLNPIVLIALRQLVGAAFLAPVA